MSTAARIKKYITDVRGYYSHYEYWDDHDNSWYGILPGNKLFLGIDCGHINACYEYDINTEESIYHDKNADIDTDDEIFTWRYTETIDDIKWYVPPRCKGSWIYGAITFVYEAFIRDLSNNYIVSYRNNVINFSAADHNILLFPDKLVFIPGDSRGYKCIITHMNFNKPFVVPNTYNTYRDREKKQEINYLDQRSQTKYICRSGDVDFMIDKVIRAFRDESCRPKFIGFEDCILRTIDQNN